MKRERIKFTVEVDIWYVEGSLGVDSKELGIKRATDCLTEWSCSFVEPVSAAVDMRDISRTCGTKSD